MKASIILAFMVTASISSRNTSASSDTKLPPEVRRALAYIGLFGRVAKRMQITTGHVSHVARGNRTSPRVVAAIVEEVRKIDAAAQKGRAA